MDEGANRIGDPPGRTAVLEREAAELRERLDSLLAELDQRRWRARGRLGRLRQMALPVLGGAVAIAGLLTAMTWLQRRRTRGWRERLALAMHMRELPLIRR
jgi:hypothetical protein